MGGLIHTKILILQAFCMYQPKGLHTLGHITQLFGKLFFKFQILNFDLK